MYKFRGKPNISGRSLGADLQLGAVLLVWIASGLTVCDVSVWAESPLPSARTELDSGTVWRGSAAHVRVVTEWHGEPDALVVLPVEYPEIEHAEWHDQRLSSERDGAVNRVVQTASLRVAEAGDTVTVPEIVVKYLVRGEEDEKELRTEPAELRVRSIPFGAPLAGAVLVGAGVCAGVWLAVRMKRRQRAGRTDEAVSGAGELLERDLRSLRRLRLAGDYGAYFMGLVRIAREVDPAAVDQGPLSEVAAMIESARYGGYRPDKELAERAYRAVERLLKRVEETQLSEGG